MNTDIERCLRRVSEAKIEGARLTRLSWWGHWGSLAEMYLPRRYKWLIQPNVTNRGNAINQAIIDETGVLAARGCAAGMLGGLTSQTRPWFRLGFEDATLAQYTPVRLWLSETQKRMMKVFARSNFYTAMATYYHDLVVFGSASLLELEDPKEVIRFYNPCLGEFFFIAGKRFDVDSQGREFTFTVKQTVDEFGLENCSPNVQGLYKGAASNLGQEVVIQHIIEPNEPFYYQDTRYASPVAKKFPWREQYWERGQADAGLLRTGGFDEQPFFPGRWDVVSNDPYGRSPGMDGYPAVRQLQVEQRRKGEVMDKAVRPPMVASVSMKNEPRSILPAAVNYVVDTDKAGFKPAYQVDVGGIQYLMTDIKEVQARINSVFYMDLFAMISQLETVRTATEIDARIQEKLIQLGPVVERIENEDLDKIIDRTFGIMLRRGLIAPPPQEIRGQKLQVQYVSMLAESQRAASTNSIERVLAITGNLAAARPEAMDKININATIDIYADTLGTDPRIINDDKVVAAMQAARAKQQASMQQAAMLEAAAKSGKVLSDTQLGGGDTALNRIMGNA